MRLIGLMPGQEKNGAPGEIRTPDLLLRRQPLYPAELRARTVFTVYMGKGNSFNVACARPERPPQTAAIAGEPVLSRRRTAPGKLQRYRRGSIKF